MRVAPSLGYNIMYGIADTFETAASLLQGEMRKAYDQYDVELLGGLNVKDDAKNRFNVAREVYLTTKTSPEDKAVTAVDVALQAVGGKRKAKQAEVKA